MDLGLKDKVVLVTGGSSGIGLACVSRFLREGAIVFTCGRRPEALQSARDALTGQGLPVERLHTRPLDVLDAAAVQSLADAISGQFGRLDALVNNAGQARLSTFATTSLADWQEELNLKFMSVINPVNACLPLLQGGETPAIVVVNSLLARQPEQHMVCTSAARAGVQNLVKSLSVEFAPHIRVNSILLGTVNSGQWARRYAERAKPGQSLDDWLSEMARERHIPLGRMGRPEEAADAIAFLSSPVAGFITGASLEVAGGVSRFA